MSLAFVSKGHIYIYIQYTNKTIEEIIADTKYFDTLHHQIILSEDVIYESTYILSSDFSCGNFSYKSLSDICTV